MATSSKLLLVGVLAFLALFAFVSLFGFFSPYDDEGYSVAMVRLVSEGVPLYTGQFAYHGPIPYWAKALTLRALGVPITNQAIRLWVLAIWVLSSALLGTAIKNLTGRPAVGIAGCLVIGTHLFALRFNPGHPEDFVVLFLALAIWLVSIDAPWWSENLRAAALGIVGAVLLGTKINVGMLYLLGLSAWMFVSFPAGRLRNIIGWLFLACATATPALLLHTFLLAEWQLLLISTGSIFLCIFAFLSSPLQLRYGIRQALWCAASLVLALMAMFLAATFSGSHLKDLLDGMIVTAAKHSNILLRPLSFGMLTVPLLGIFSITFLLMLTKLRSHAPTSEFQLSPLLKLILSLSGLLFATLKMVAAYMPLAGPICWLIAFPVAKSSGVVPQRSARVFVACMAVFQMLQVFPITGTQTVWSTLPLSVCCLLLATDGLTELSYRPGGIPKFAQAFGGIVAILAIASPIVLSVEQGISYSRMPGLGLGRSNLIRLPLEMKANFDWVAASIDRYCDAVVTQPGMNSLLLWSKLQPARESASPVLISGWPLIFTEEQERSEIARLSKAARVCAVYNQVASDWWTNDGPQLTPATLSRQPLVSYIRGLQPIRKVGNYEIRVDRAVAEQWGDDYVLNGVRAIEGDRNAIGVPSELLLSRPDTELLFGFQVSRPGPLLSAQQPTDSASASLTYIAKNGTLMAPNGLGNSMPLSGGRSVIDGKWHELAYRRQSGGWQVSLDGAMVGWLPEFVDFSKGRQTLQLGPVFQHRRSESDAWLPFYGKLRDVRVKTSSPRFPPTESWRTSE